MADIFILPLRAFGAARFIKTFRSQNLMKTGQDVIKLEIQGCR